MGGSRVNKITINNGNLKEMTKKTVEFIVEVESFSLVCQIVYSYGLQVIYDNKSRTIEREEIYFNSIVREQN